MTTTTTTTLKRAAAAIVAIGALLAGAATAARAADPKTSYADGKSEPSQRTKLPAQVMGVVREIAVKRGDIVKKGQLLIQQDDRLAQNACDIAEKEANSTIRVDAAQADLDQKKVELKRVEGLYTDPNGRGATDLEYERAKLDVVFKTHQLSLAHLELAKAKLEAVGAKLKLEYMKIVAPYDGVVASIDIGVGDLMDPQRPGGLEIVQNDPVRVVVQLTAPQAARLKKGDTMDVRYKIDPSDAWQQATVDSLAPVASAGAGCESKREVHLSLPNPTNRETGLWLFVKLPEVTSTADGATASPAPAAQTAAAATPVEASR